MYVVFRCPSCGRYLYAKEKNKTRECPCNKTVKIKQAKKVQKTEDRKKASELVRKLQEKEHGKPFFGRFKDE